MLLEIQWQTGSPTRLPMLPSLPVNPWVRQETQPTTLSPVLIRASPAVGLLHFLACFNAEFKPSGEFDHSLFYFLFVYVSVAGRGVRTPQWG